MLAKNERLAFLVKRLLRLVKSFGRFLQKKAHEKKNSFFVIFQNSFELFVER